MVKEKKTPTGGRGKERVSVQKLVDQPELLQKLYEIRVTEQFSWAELADIEYPKLTDGDTIDWRTLRRAMVSESSITLIPDRVSNQSRVAVQHLWDKVDMLQMIMTVLQGRFIEWSMLHDKHIRHMVDDNIIKFSSDELRRLDFLTNEMISFFFRATTIMRDLQSGDSLGFLARATQPSEVDASEDSESRGGAITTEYLQSVVEGVAIESQKMLEAVNVRHRAEGRGHHRPIETDDSGDENTI